MLLVYAESVVYAESLVYASTHIIMHCLNVPLTLSRSSNLVAVANFSGLHCVRDEVGSVTSVEWELGCLTYVGMTPQCTAPPVVI